MWVMKEEVGAAIRLFNERERRWYRPTTLRRRPGISPGNLYYHFRNKEEVIRAIFGRMMAAWEATFELPQDRAPTLTDVRGMLEETYSVLWEYRFLYREFVALLRRDPELGRSYREIRKSGLANTEFLLQNIRSGRDPAETRRPESVARAGEALLVDRRILAAFRGDG